MRRSFSLLCACALLVCACERARMGEAKGAGALSVVTTVFPLYDFARVVGGGKVDVTMLLPPATESHSFEPTPRDIIKIDHSDVFLYIGGESEAWVARLLESSDLQERTVVAMLGTVNAVREETLEGMEAPDEAEADALDEHIWTAPVNAVHMVAAIVDAFADRDRENAAFYRRNADEYITSLYALDRGFRDAVDAGARKTVVFGDRFPFRYLADAYGLRCFAAFPGCATETEPSAATVAFLIDMVRSEHIPVVFHIELSNEKIADTICEATGAKKRLLHSCHNLTKKEFENGTSYLELQTANIAALQEALR